MSEQENTDNPPASSAETIKTASNGLRGAIAGEFAEDKSDFSEESVILLKHHGTYQQDNRDIRNERKKAGQPWDYKFMVRTKFPGGRLTAEQHLICDDLATRYGQDDLRVTSRQGYQVHGVVRRNLRPLIHDLNTLASITTYGACGDVVRNVMACPVDDIDPRFKDYAADLARIATAISNYFLPKSNAYFDLWIDDRKVTVNDNGTVTYAADTPPEAVPDPIYQNRYLPRKFKIALTTDFDNSVDVFTNDLGIIAATENGRLAGFEFVVGGGLGYTHRKPETYSRLATPLAFVQEADILPLTEAIVKVQRDFGGRANRRHARMKYLIDDWGIDQFRAKVFEYAGRAYPEPRGLVPGEQPDYLGWSQQIQPGLNYVGLWVENGRVRDFPDSHRFKTGLRDIVERFRPDIRLTPHHNVILANIRDEDVHAVQDLLDQYKIPTDKGISTIRRLEMACPALPLCGLALAEAERAMPAIMSALEAAGHADTDIIIRMSGCPNNCSRPRSAELGIVGSGSDRYQVYVGGAHNGSRLNELVAEKLKAADIPALLANLLDIWKSERNPDERFGDWSARIGIDNLKARIAAK